MYYITSASTVKQTSVKKYVNKTRSLAIVAQYTIYLHQVKKDGALNATVFTKILRPIVWINLG